MSYIPEPVTRTDKYLSYIAGNMDVALPDHPITRKEHYLAAWAEKSGFEDVDVVGEPPLTLENAIGKPLKGLRIYGKSKQVTTTGAQLFPPPMLGSQEKNGITIDCMEDGKIRISGTAEILTDFYVSRLQLSAGTYTSSAGVNIDASTLRYALATPGGVPYYDVYGDYTTATIAKTIDVSLLLRVYAGKTIDLTVQPMLNAGSTHLPWEPYTGGQPSPSPDYPQEIESVVNPTVKVTNEDELKAQSVTFNNITLNAIPVSSGGNVTINGQQYIADYVDVERGKLVKKLKSFTRTDIKTLYTWGVNKNADNITGFFFYTKDSDLPEADNAVMMSTILRYNSSVWGGTNVGCAMNITGKYTMLSVPTYALEDISSDENACASFTKICENTNAIFFYSMASPIETPLTSDQLAAYKQLYTYKGTTIIDNNAGAYMSARYEKMK